MRQIILTAAIVLTAGSAMASSIEVIGGGNATKAGSIIAKSCRSCPPLLTPEAKKDYVVPTLQPGAFQASVIKDVDGKEKLYRTENWMGGSPVLFVSKASPEAVAAAKPLAAPDGIDISSTTAALISGDAKPVTGDVAAAPQLDTSGFTLRSQ
jgi:hypothetical protein